jgi:hypothetical protein
VGRAGAEARTIAEGAATIEGDIDAWRAASPGERPAIEARIRGKAQELQDRARAVQDEVESIEAGARAFPETTPEDPAPDAPAP